MRIKLFHNTTGLERGDFIVAVQDQVNFDLSAHQTESVTAVESNEDNLEVLIDGNRYVLDLSNEPTVTETQYAKITGYEAKSGGGYQATWAVETLPTPDPEPE